MDKFLAITIITSILSAMVIFDFNEKSSLKNWYIINDNVMGGVSQSTISINEDGNAVFKGSVSLENNGGFCSVRYNFEEIDVTNFEKITFRIKGEGEKYQFRIRANRDDYYSYIKYFETSGKWQTIEISLREMYPVFRGRKLEMPNFSQKKIEEIAFLIGNKKEENFQLEIDKIELK